MKKVAEDPEWHEREKARRRALHYQKRDYFLAYLKARYRADPEKYKAQTKAYKQANREKYREYHRKYKLKYPHKVIEHWMRRQARLRVAPGGSFDLSRPDYRARVDYYGGRCAHCGTREATTLDHAIPVSRGGGNWPSNIYPACALCNGNKSSRKLHFEWSPPRLSSASY